MSYTDAMDFSHFASHQVHPYGINERVKNDVLTRTKNSSKREVKPSKVLDKLHAQLSTFSNERSSVAAKAKHSRSFEHTKIVNLWKQPHHLSNVSYSHEGRIINNNRSNSLNAANKTCFSNNSEKSTSSSVDSQSNVISRVVQVRETYDNDYDYLENGSANVTKQFNRPYHHMPLLKSGKLKASSLWTLLEESESIADDTSSSLKRYSIITSSKEENTKSSLSPLQQNVGSKDAYSNYSTHCVNTSWTQDQDQKDLACNFLNSDQIKRSYSNVNTKDGRRFSGCVEETEKSFLNKAELVHVDSNVGIKYNPTTEGSVFGRSDNKRTSSSNESDSGVVTSNSRSSSVYVTNGDSKNHHFYTGQGDLDSSHLEISELGSCFIHKNLNNEELLEGRLMLDKLSQSLAQFATTDQQLLQEKFNSHSDRNTTDLRGNCRSQLLLCSTSSPSYEVPFVERRESDQSDTTSCNSQSLSEVSDLSVYMCTGTAEVTETDEPDYDNSTYTLKMKLKSILKKKEESAFDKETQISLNQNEPSTDYITETTVVDCTQTQENINIAFAGKQQHSYNGYTSGSEKTKNIACDVAQQISGNASSKKSSQKPPSKPTRGTMIMKFLCKLGCISEPMNSPACSPCQSRKLLNKSTKTQCAKVQLSVKERISSPKLISSTSIHHYDIFHETDNCSNQSSSNQSLDSVLSRTDSAYSSISESAIGVINIPFLYLEDSDLGSLV